MPTFLTGCLGFPLDQASILSALPWLLTAICLYAGGVIADKLTRRYSTTYVRKLIMAISLIVRTLALLITTVVTKEHRILTVITIVIAVGTCGLTWSGYGVNHLDIGAQYAGVLMGLSNCAGSMPGFLVPTLTGHIVQNTASKREWNIIFIISIFVCIVALIFYLVFADGELQPWASNNSDENQQMLSASLSRDVSQANKLNQVAPLGGTIDDITDPLRGEIAEEAISDNDGTQ